MRRLIADRDEYLINRERLATESAARFSADVCLARHAAVLGAVATGADLPVIPAFTFNPKRAAPDAGSVITATEVPCCMRRISPLDPPAGVILLP